MILPRGTTLYHATYDPAAIEAGGFWPSANGESGPGVYLSPTPDVARNYPERTLLTVRTTRALTLLDRTTETGERTFRAIQDTVHGWYTTASPATRMRAFMSAGYDGIYYDSNGDVEVVVFHPAHLSARARGEGTE